MKTHGSVSLGSIRTFRIQSHSSIKTERFERIDTHEKKIIKESNLDTNRHNKHTHRETSVKSARNNKFLAISSIKITIFAD